MKVCGKEYRWDPDDEVWDEVPSGWHFVVLASTVVGFWLLVLWLVFMALTN